MVFGKLLRNLLRDPNYGKRVTPIIPDEARTFGMESLFREFNKSLPAHVLQHRARLRNLRQLNCFHAPPNLSGRTNLRNIISTPPHCINQARDCDNVFLTEAIQD